MQILQSQGSHSPEKAAELAIAITARISERHGGQRVYIARGTWNGNAIPGMSGPRRRPWFELIERDWAIYREANRRLEKHERDAICAKHLISESRLYQIMAACRAEIAASRPPLPVSVKVDRG